MQYEATHPKEYFELLEEDWRKEKLMQVREMIQKIAPELQEGIEYKMLCYKKGDKSIFHLNAQKAYVGLYVGNIDKVENARDLLSNFDMGKGCIRIKKRINLPESNLETFISETIKIWEQGGETDC